LLEEIKAKISTAVMARAPLQIEINNTGGETVEITQTRDTRDVYERRRRRRRR
jgi:hypothetical protein